MGKQEGRRGLPAFLLLCLAPLVAGVATDGIRIDAPGRGAWEPLLFPGISRRTLYAPVSIDGREAVRAESRCSASALVLPLGSLDLARTPWLSWEWRVEQALHEENPRAKAGDDFAARVYVAFAFEARAGSIWDRLRRRALAAVFGVELPGNALNYVWSAREPAGATWASPFTPASKLISRGAPPGWHREEVDLLSDYRALFGRGPPAPVALALMSDSDNSCQSAVAYFAGFRFLGSSGSRAAGTEPAGGLRGGEGVREPLEGPPGDEGLRERPGVSPARLPGAGDAAAGPPSAAP